MMNKKQLIFACLVMIIFLSGCGGKAAIGKGGGKYSIPFDFPYDKTALNNDNSSVQDESVNNNQGNVRLSGDTEVMAVEREGF